MIEAAEAIERAGPAALGRWRGSPGSAAAQGCTQGCLEAVEGYESYELDIFC